MDRSNDKSIRVLFVEDDDQYTACVTSVGGNEVLLERAARLDDAIERIRNQPFDVVLTDISLPDSQGLDVVRQLRESAPALPIVLFSSTDSDAIRTGARRLGVHEFIRKPTETSETALSSELSLALERALNERRFRNIVASLADAAVVVDGDGNVLYTNAAAGELFGRPTSAMLGRPFGYPISAGAEEISIRREDASTRIAEMRVVDFRWNEERAFLASIRDISERRRAETLRRTINEADREAAMGQLASGVAHAINNPAAVLQSNLGVLKTEADGLAGALDHLRDQLTARLGSEAAAIADDVFAQAGIGPRLEVITGIAEDAVSATKKISDTMRELRGVAQLESDELESCDVNDLIRSACSLVDREISTNARLHFELGSLPRIRVHRTRMIQAFVSLLLNAARAVAAKREQGSIRVVSRYADGAVEVLVKDTGCGLGIERQARLFDAAFAHGRAGAEGPLSLANETVRRHRGQLTCSSELGVGTCLTVQLPLDADATVPTMRPRRGSILTRASHKILLIDDEPMLRRAMRRILEPPHKVTEAEHGADALAILAEGNDFDVVICDISMPTMGGVALFDELKVKHPHLIDRLVFVSGGTVDSAVDTFIALEEPTVLEKPVSRDLLLGIVDRVGESQREDQAG